MYRARPVCRSTRHIAAILLALALSLLTACAGTAASVPKIPAVPNTVVAAKQFLYITGFTNTDPTAGTATIGNVNGFEINSDGSLTAVAGSPFVASGLGAGALVADNTGHFLFTPMAPSNNAAPGQIATFTVDPNTGALTQTSTASLPTGFGAAGIAVSPVAPVLFAATAAPASPTTITVALSTFQIGASGQLTLIASTQVPVAQVTENGIAVSPNGRFVYLSSFLPGPNNLGPRAITVATVDAASGVVQSITNSAVGIGTPGTPPANIVVDQTGMHLYRPEASTPSIDVFSLDANGNPTAKLQTVDCQCDAGPDFGGPAKLDVQGRFLFQATGQDGGVAVYSISAADGTLTPLSASWVGPVGSPLAAFAEDRTGNFLYVADWLNSNIAAVKIDTHGATTLLPGSPFPVTHADAFGGAITVTPQ